jgi:hypothetical protein
MDRSTDFYACSTRGRRVQNEIIHRPLAVDRGLVMILVCFQPVVVGWIACLMPPSRIQMSHTKSEAASEQGVRGFK